MAKRWFPKWTAKYPSVRLIAQRDEAFYHRLLFTVSAYDEIAQLLIAEAEVRTRGDWSVNPGKDGHAMREDSAPIVIED